MFASLEPGMEAALGSRGLRIGEMEVRLGGAEIWEPCPDWDRLRRKRWAIEGRLQRVQAMALDQVSKDSLLGLLLRGDSRRRAVKSRDLAGLGKPDGLGKPVRSGIAEPQDLTGRTGVRGKPVRSEMVVMREALGYLRVGWGGDGAALVAGGRLLAGLGGGLTPAGDDFLTGVMLWAWLAHPEPQGFCRSLLEASAARTTMLSAAFLRCVAAGECSAAWHALLAALDGGSERQLADAVKSVLSFGHTSGADALAGFVWMGLAPAQAETTRAATGS
jgi:hypothetical protein